MFENIFCKKSTIIFYQCLRAITESNYTLHYKNAALPPGPKKRKNEFNYIYIINYYYYILILYLLLLFSIYI